MKIIEQINETDFVIRVEEKQDFQFVIQHDYIGFYKNQALLTAAGVPTLTGRYAVCANVISIPCHCQIGIREMQDIIMPLLKEHEYMQADHLKDRFHDEDDKYFKQHGLTEPRYKKGDPYPAYSYGGTTIIHYYKDKQRMVAIQLAGEKTVNHVTKQFFDLHIKHTLNA